MAVDTLLTRWRLVNQQANDTEHRILEQSVKYALGLGPAPLEKERALAAQLRHEARTLFAVALRQVDAIAVAARQRVGSESPTG